MIPEFKGLFCYKCGADASKYIRTYPNPDDPEEEIYHCLKCGAHEYSLSSQSSRRTE